MKPWQVLSLENSISSAQELCRKGLTLTNKQGPELRGCMNLLELRLAQIAAAATGIDGLIKELREAVPEEGE